MEENLLFNEDIKSRYTNRLYRTCYDMKNDQTLGDIKMATCLNLRPRNNFQILENLMANKQPNNNNNQLVELIDIKKRPQYSNDYKKLLVLKQKIENSFRTKNKNKSIDKTTLIDLNKSSSSVINSNVINVKSASNKEEKDSEKINKHLLVGSSSSNNINNNNNGTGLIKYLGIKKKQHKIIEKLENLKEKDLRRNLSKQVNATRVKNKFNFESVEDECLDSNEVSINNYQQYQQSTTTTNTRSHYDLDCLKSICDTNKVYLKNLYKNFDIPILYCDSETQFNKTKTDLIDESEECDLVEVVIEDTNKKPPFLKMNPIQFNYKNVRQPRSLLNQHSKIKKPHWVNIATVGKLNDIKKPYQNTSPNRKITSHLIAQKPEPSLIFVSTFSSFSSLSEYLKIKKPLESNESTTEQQQIGSRKTSRKSLNKIHSEEIYSECSRVKSKSTVSSPIPNYSQSIPDEFGGDDDSRRKSSFSDLTSTQCKLPDLISSPKVYVLNKNSQTQAAQQKTKQSFITQTQVYKKLSELQRQNTFEYLKFVSVKNLKENNHENNYSSNNQKKIKNTKKNLENGKFEAPKISKKILLRENSAIHETMQKQRELNGKKENKIISYDTKDDDYDYFRATSLSFNDDDDDEMDELKIQDDDGDYDNDNDNDDDDDDEEEDDENQEPDFVITQNSKTDQISESNTTTNTNANNIDLDEELEPKLGKSQSLCTHILTSSSQLRDFFQYSSTTNSTKSLNLILKNNLQFKEALTFMYNEKQVRKLHQKVLEKLEQQRSSTDIRLINFISSNLNYTTRSNFDCYKFYERSKTSSLLQSLRHKLYDQITMVNKLKTNSELLLSLDKSQDLIEN